jgi:hypothetical protein
MTDDQTPAPEGYDKHAAMMAKPRTYRRANHLPARDQRNHIGDLRDDYQRWKRAQ